MFMSIMKSIKHIKIKLIQPNLLHLQKNLTAAAPITDSVAPMTKCLVRKLLRSPLICGLARADMMMCSPEVQEKQ